MFKKTVVNLLLLAIIACPFHCMGRLSSVLPDNQSFVPVCRCRIPTSANQATVPNDCYGQSPSDECPTDDRCPSCICHGAIVAMNSFAGTQRVGVLWRGTIAQILFVFGNQGISLDTSKIVLRNDLSKPTGIFLRISHQSLVI